MVNKGLCGTGSKVPGYPNKTGIMPVIVPEVSDFASRLDATSIDMVKRDRCKPILRR